MEVCNEMLTEEKKNPQSHFHTHRRINKSHLVTAIIFKGSNKGKQQKQQNQY